ncbi:unnamed protein product [Amoebophrya sp. A120]|nr:unnamed protein product [Amoebophrya sp. A120]|eukprot:GSA120T00009981001.1
MVFFGRRGGSSSSTLMFGRRRPTQEPRNAEQEARSNNDDRERREEPTGRLEDLAQEQIHNFHDHAQDNNYDWRGTYSLQQPAEPAAASFSRRGSMSSGGDDHRWNYTTYGRNSPRRSRRAPDHHTQNTPTAATSSSSSYPRVVVPRGHYGRWDVVCPPDAQHTGMSTPPSSGGLGMGSGGAAAGTTAAPPPQVLSSSSAAVAEQGFYHEDEFERYYLRGGSDVGRRLAATSSEQVDARPAAPAGAPSSSSHPNRPANGGARRNKGGGRGGESGKRGAEDTSSGGASAPRMNKGKGGRTNYKGKDTTSRTRRGEGEQQTTARYFEGLDVLSRPSGSNTSPAPGQEPYNYWWHTSHDQMKNVKESADHEANIKGLRSTSSTRGNKKKSNDINWWTGRGSDGATKCDTSYKDRTGARNRPGRRGEVDYSGNTKQGQKKLRKEKQLREAEEERKTKTQPAPIVDPCYLDPHVLPYNEFRQFCDEQKTLKEQRSKKNLDRSRSPPLRSINKSTSSFPPLITTAVAGMREKAKAELEAKYKYPKSAGAPHGKQQELRLWNKDECEVEFYTDIRKEQIKPSFCGFQQLFCDRNGSAVDSFNLDPIQTCCFAKDDSEDDNDFEENIKLDENNGAEERVKGIMRNMKPHQNQLTQVEKDHLQAHYLQKAVFGAKILKFRFNRHSPEAIYIFEMFQLLFSEPVSLPRESGLKKKLYYLYLEDYFWACDEHDWRLFFDYVMKFYENCGNYEDVVLSTNKNNTFRSTSAHVAACRRSSKVKFLPQIPEPKFKHFVYETFLSQMQNERNKHRAQYLYEKLCRFVIYSKDEKRDMPPLCPSLVAYLRAAGFDNIEEERRRGLPCFFQDALSTHRSWVYPNPDFDREKHATITKQAKHDSFAVVDDESPPGGLHQARWAGKNGKGQNNANHASASVSFSSSPRPQGDLFDTMNENGASAVTAATVEDRKLRPSILFEEEKFREILHPGGGYCPVDTDCLGLDFQPRAGAGLSTTSIPNPVERSACKFLMRERPVLVGRSSTDFYTNGRGKDHIGNAGTSRSTDTTTDAAAATLLEVLLSPSDRLFAKELITNLRKARKFCRTATRRKLLNAYADFFEFGNYDKNAVELGMKDEVCSAAPEEPFIDDGVLSSGESDKEVVAFHLLDDALFLKWKNVFDAKYAPKSIPTGKPTWRMGHGISDDPSARAANRSSRQPSKSNSRDIRDVAAQGAPATLAAPADSTAGGSLGAIIQEEQKIDSAVLVPAHDEGASVEKMNDMLQELLEFEGAFVGMLELRDPAAVAQNRAEAPKTIGADCALGLGQNISASPRQNQDDYIGASDTEDQDDDLHYATQEAALTFSNLPERSPEAVLCGPRGSTSFYKDFYLQRISSFRGPDDDESSFIGFSEFEKFGGDSVSCLKLTEQRAEDDDSKSTMALNFLPLPWGMEWNVKNAAEADHGASASECHALMIRRGPPQSSLPRGHAPLLPGQRKEPPSLHLLAAIDCKTVATTEQQGVNVQNGIRAGPPSPLGENYIASRTRTFLKLKPTPIFAPLPTDKTEAGNYNAERKPLFDTQSIINVKEVDSSKTSTSCFFAQAYPFARDPTVLLSCTGNYNYYKSAARCNFFTGDVDTVALQAVRMKKLVQDKLDTVYFRRIVESSTTSSGREVLDSLSFTRLNDKLMYLEKDVLDRFLVDPRTIKSAEELQRESCKSSSTSPGNANNKKTSVKHPYEFQFKGYLEHETFAGKFDKVGGGGGKGQDARRGGRGKKSSRIDGIKRNNRDGDSVGSCRFSLQWDALLTEVFTLYTFMCGSSEFLKGLVRSDEGGKQGMTEKKNEGHKSDKINKPVDYENTSAAGKERPGAAGEYEKSRPMQGKTTSAATETTDDERSVGADVTEDVLESISNSVCSNLFERKKQVDRAKNERQALEQLQRMVLLQTAHDGLTALHEAEFVASRPFSDHDVNNTRRASDRTTISTSTAASLTAASNQQEQQELHSALYGVLKRYILNCYMNLSCKITMSHQTIKPPRMTNTQRAKQHLNRCRICDAKGASLPLSLLRF